MLTLDFWYLNFLQAGHNVFIFTVDVSKKKIIGCVFLIIWNTKRLHRNDPAKST